MLSNVKDGFVCTDVPSGHLNEVIRLCYQELQEGKKPVVTTDAPIDENMTLVDMSRVAQVEVPLLTEVETKELIESPLLRQSVERIGYKDCMKLTSLVTGKSILLPAGSVCMDTSGPHGVSAGFFWSSQIVYSPNNPKPYEATCAVIYPEVASSTFNTMSTQKMPRAYGMNIRPVLRK